MYNLLGGVKGCEWMQDLTNVFIQRCPQESRRLAPNSVRRLGIVVIDDQQETMLGIVPVD